MLAALAEFIHSMGIFNLTFGHVLMIGIACLLIYLAIVKGFEPLLLVPISIGALISNLPAHDLIVQSPIGDQPGGLFWYTSGTVGPYYINTHYLFGGPGPATELLEFIDREKGDGAALADSLHRRAVRQCDTDPDYRAVIELLAARGLSLAWTRCIGDDRDRITGALRDAFAKLRDGMVWTDVEALVGFPANDNRNDTDLTWQVGAVWMNVVFVSTGGKMISGAALKETANDVGQYKSFNV